MKYVSVAQSRAESAPPKPRKRAATPAPEKSADEPVETTHTDGGPTASQSEEG